MTSGKYVGKLNPVTVHAIVDHPVYILFVIIDTEKTVSYTHACTPIHILTQAKLHTLLTIIEKCFGGLLQLIPQLSRRGKKHLGRVNDRSDADGDLVQ